MQYEFGFGSSLVDFKLSCDIKVGAWTHNYPQLITWSPFTNIIFAP